MNADANREEPREWNGWKEHEVLQSAELMICMVT